MNTLFLIYQIINRQIIYFTQLLHFHYCIYLLYYLLLSRLLFFFKSQTQKLFNIMRNRNEMFKTFYGNITSEDMLMLWY